VEVKKGACDEAEKQYLESGLRETQGKVTELAMRIELNRSRLQTLLKKHGLRSKDFKHNRES
jgi:DNA-binding NtrC family response regulator